MRACGNTGAPKGRGPGRLATWGRVSGQRSARWLAEGVGERGSGGAPEWGIPAGPAVGGRGLSRALRVSRPGGRRPVYFYSVAFAECAADGRRPPGSFAFCSFSLSEASAAGSGRAGSQAWEGAADGVARYEAGVHWGGGQGAGWAGAAGRFWAAAELWGECLSPALEAPRRGTGVCAVNHGGEDTSGA